jgi:hypothetical protein
MVNILFKIALANKQGPNYCRPSRILGDDIARDLAENILVMWIGYSMLRVHLSCGILSCVGEF